MTQLKSHDALLRLIVMAQGCPLRIDAALRQDLNDGDTHQQVLVWRLREMNWDNIPIGETPRVIDRLNEDFTMAYRKTLAIVLNSKLSDIYVQKLQALNHAREALVGDALHAFGLQRGSMDGYESCGAYARALSDVQDLTAKWASSAKGKNRGTRRKRGRPRTRKVDEERYKGIYDRWQQAKEANVSKMVFCKDEGIDPGEHTRIVDLFGQRKRREEKNQR